MNCHNICYTRGPRGLIGPIGNIGSQGLTGSTGPTGPMSDVFIEGPTGSNGLRGDTGPQGSVGYQLDTVRHINVSSIPGSSNILPDDKFLYYSYDVGQTIASFTIDSSLNWKNGTNIEIKGIPYGMNTIIPLTISISNTNNNMFITNGNNIGSQATITSTLNSNAYVIITLFNNLSSLTPNILWIAQTTSEYEVINIS